MLCKGSKAQANLSATLGELQAKIDSRKDDAVDFRTMGIDHIFVDECHMFKNLMFQTRRTRVAGIGNTRGSQRAIDLLFAIRDIQRRTNSGTSGLRSCQVRWSSMR